MGAGAQGHVMVARTPTDDPDAIQQLAEPIVMEAVPTEMLARGLTLSTESPDVTLKYYLLLTVGSSAQTVGQFLPAVTQWAVPSFLPSTQSLKVIQQGSLALDFSAKGEIGLARGRRSGDQAGAHPGAKGGAHPRSGTRNPEALPSTEIALTLTACGESTPLRRDTAGPLYLRLIAYRHFSARY